VLDELLRKHKDPEDLRPDRAQLSKALIERAMQAELIGHIGYEESKA